MKPVDMRLLLGTFFVILILCYAICSHSATGNIQDSILWLYVWIDVKNILQDILSGDWTMLMADILYFLADLINAAYGQRVIEVPR